MTRVLVVEDSPVMQSILSQILASDPDLEVIGVAGDGEQGVSMAMALRPDVITMDIRMPRVNGFEATRRIMQECPTPIVIVCASVDAPDLEICYNAIKAGALTVVEKPVGLLAAPDGQQLGKQLITTVKLMAEVKVVTRRNIQSRKTLSRQLPQPPVIEKKIFAIASSTGGPAALHNILCGLPPDFASPILIVQHIGEGFLNGLVNWLNLESKIKVKVAGAGECIQGGTAYLAPSGFHMEVNKGWIINLHKLPPIAGFRPSATILFDSLARNYGQQAVGVILTGMGSDGVEGLRVLKTAGGMVVAQDEQSCVVFGMPKEAIDSGIVDYIVPLEDIPRLMLNNL